MNSRQAKDFLAQETAEQAALDGVSLSEVEQKMMYFTESDPTSCDDPIKLNDEFEACHEAADYETKISGLTHRRYERLKTEDPAKKRIWDQAVRELRQGDHYFLVLWDLKSRELPKYDSIKLLGAGLLVAAVFGIACVLAAKYDIDLDRYRDVEYAILFVVGAAVLAFSVLRSFFEAVFAWFRRRMPRDE